MNYFDLVVCILAVLFFVLGLTRGFFKTLASLFGWMIAFILAIVLARVVADWLTEVGFIRNLFFRDGEGFSFYGKIYSAMPETLKQVGREEMISATSGEDPVDGLIDLISRHSALLGFFVGLFKGTLVEPLADPNVLAFSFENLAQALSILISGVILTVFAGILLFLALRICTFAIGLLLGGYKLPLNLDRIMGGVLGVARAIGYTIVIFMAMGLMMNFGFMKPLKTELYGEATHDKAVILPVAEWTFELTDKLMKQKNTERLFEASDFVVDEAGAAEEV